MMGREFEVASPPLLEMRQIEKTFPGVKALDGVDITIGQAEIHALVGENGAGKSTLMKILSGVYPYGSYGGDIWLDGVLCKFHNISQSEAMGIAIIHQELALIPYLSIAENIFLGDEQARFNIIDWDKTTLSAVKFCKKLGLEEDPHTPVFKLGVGKQQLVEIARALAKKVKLLILDEPTAALSEKDSQNLLSLLQELKTQQGISCVLITHKLNEIAQVADKITIIRDGKTIESLVVRTKANQIASIKEERIIEGMVGRQLTDRFPKRKTTVGNKVFEVKNWTVCHPEYPEHKVLSKINLHIKAGEVVGLAGLVGSGRTELATSLYGHYYGANISGLTYIAGQVVNLNTIPKAIEKGLVYVTEDRKEYGLVLTDDIKHNITLSKLHKIANKGVVKEQDEIRIAEGYRKNLHIKTPSIQQTVGNLSGGNQQKVVLAKWIFSDPKILILDEPTRGIDVGAKYEIYTIINQLVEQGLAVLLISSEMSELLGMCDRIYVMNEGRLVGELNQHEATQEKIMSAILQNKELH